MVWGVRQESARACDESTRSETALVHLIRVRRALCSWRSKDPGGSWTQKMPDAHPHLFVRLLSS